MEDRNQYAYSSFTSWDQAEPSFLGNPQFFPKVRYLVTPGTFVTVTINNRSEIVKILTNPVSARDITTGQAIHVDSPGASCIKVNVYSRLQRILAEYAAKSIHLKPDESIESAHTRTMNEIVQTSFYLWIDTSLINGFCFPFHKEDIESGRHNVTGMEMAFVLRYRLSLDCTSLEEIHSDSFKTFPSEYEDHNTAFRKSSDVSHKLYNALNCIRVELGKMLNTSSLAEGTWNKKTRKVETFPEEAWEFIKAFVETQVEAEAVNRKRTIGMVRSLLELASYRRLIEVEVLHFEEDQQLDRLNSLLGSAICFGLRGKSKPKAGSSYALSAGDNINYVTSTNSVTAEDPRQNPKGPSRFGIFLHYDTNSKQMTLGAYYETIVVQNSLYKDEEPRTKRLRLFLDEMRKKDAADANVAQFRLPPDPSSITLQEGMDFQNGNQVFIVKSVGNGSVVAIMADEQGHPVATVRHVSSQRMTLGRSLSSS